MNQKKANLCAGILLSIFFMLAFFSLPSQSMIVDEIMHIPSGYSYWKSFDYRLNPEHPPLAKLAAGLPLQFLELRARFSGDAWDNSKVYDWETSKNTLNQYEWIYNFYFVDNKTDVDKILYWSRIPMVLIGVILGWFIFVFARALYGNHAGLLALALYAFSPNFLGHTRYVTTDVPAACFSLIAVYSLWKYVKNNTPKNLIWAGIAFGLALGSKMTALYLIPIYGLLFLVAVYYRYSISSIETIVENKELQGKIIRMMKSFVIIGAIGLAVLIVMYGIINFTYYIKGVEFVVWHSTEGHPAYLLGEHAESGWWYYFFAAFLVKTPIPTIILFALSVLMFKKIPRKTPVNEWFLIIPLAVFFLVFVFNNINIGIRHIFPMYPFLYIFTSKIINTEINKLWKVTVVSLLVVWLVFGTVKIHPHYLSYFNEIGGGPGNGAEWLIDSNIDWGQDFGNLLLFFDEHEIENPHLALFGSDKLIYEKIAHGNTWCLPKNGIHAVSVSRLKGIFRQDIGCFAWLEKYEPIAKVGYSIYVYNITDVTSDPEQLLVCEEGCPGLCEERGLLHFGSYYTTKCVCDCRRGLQDSTPAI